MGHFNGKSFNDVAFGRYIEKIPSLSMSEMVKSGVLAPNGEIRRAFSSQGGTGYAILPMYGKIGGDAINYDGATDIVANKTKTYEQGVVVIGRANAWVEDDFAEDITGGVSFMTNVAKQVKEYFNEVDQLTILAILEGIFKMTDGENAKFVSEHTYDISNGVEVMLEGLEGEDKGLTILENSDKIQVATFNTAMQRACGANKGAFSLIIMHSAVATNLENLKLLNYLKYTDKEGIERNLTLGQLNGRLVIVSDYGTFDGTDKYTSYILGNGAISYENIGAKVPLEIKRDPKTNGGQDVLYARQRKSFAPYGVSYVKKNQASLSPTDAELKNGNNWALVKAPDDSKTIDHKMIPIARVISKG